MSWQHYSHRAVPTNWNSLKRAVRARDQGHCHVCAHEGADEVDHVIGVAQWRRQQLPGDPHDLTNLAMIHGARCPACGRRCHIDKTQTEARAARASRKRPVEPHPGLIR